MRCNKRIVIVADRVETYCQLELGHEPKPCSINREQLKAAYPAPQRLSLGICGKIAGAYGHEGATRPHVRNISCWNWQPVAIMPEIRQLKGGIDELCHPSRGLPRPSVAEHPAPLSRVDSVKNP